MRHRRISDFCFIPPCSPATLDQCISAEENKRLPSGYAKSFSWKLVTSHGNTTTMFLACEQALGDDGKKNQSRSKTVSPGYEFLQYDIV